MHTNLVVDVNNNIFSMRHAKIKPVSSVRKKEKFVKELLFIETLKSIMTHTKKLKADAIVLMRDSPNIWRKDIYQEYKANHTSSFDDLYYEEAIQAADMLCDFMEDYTGAKVFSLPRAEADDLIGIWCNNSTGVQNIIMSSDKDFIQLLSETTKLYSQTQDMFRESDDPAYDLFVKCVRGDPGDNVRSAYPKVRETLLKKAWGDDLEMLNLVETVLKDGRKVYDSLSLNISLIDLTQQPSDIQKSAMAMFSSTAQKPPFSCIRAMRYFAENGLKERTDVLEINQRCLKNMPIFKSH